MTERLTLPVLPLREVVLFPGVTAPIGAGRPGTLRALEAALKTEAKLVFAVAQRENTEGVDAAALHTIGTIARIGQVQRGLAGMQLLVHGERRGIAMHYAENEGGWLQAIVRDTEELAPVDAEDPAFVALHRDEKGNADGFLLVNAPVNWQIDYVVVKNESRGRGVGGALVAETLDQAYQRRVPFVTLTSKPKLRPLYEACGFTVCEPFADAVACGEHA